MMVVLALSLCLNFVNNPTPQAIPQIQVNPDIHAVINNQSGMADIVIAISLSSSIILVISLIGSGGELVSVGCTDVNGLFVVEVNELACAVRGASVRLCNARECNVGSSVGIRLGSNVGSTVGSIVGP